jgi:hypothetical protein
MAAHEVAEDLRALPQLVSRLAHVAQDAHAAAVGRVLRGALAADERLRAVLKDEVAGMHRAAAAELLVHTELKGDERRLLLSSRLDAVLRRVMPNRARPLHRFTPA